MRMVAITRKYIGTPYKLGGKSVSEGLDCISLILAIGEDLGYDLPYEFGGYNRDTYPQLYTKEPLKAKKLMVDFLKSICNEINPRLLRPRDLVLLSNPATGNVVIGMYSGSNLVLTAPESGIDLFNLDLYSIKGVFRYV